jgi:hypothetical protein
MKIFENLLICKLDSVHFWYIIYQKNMERILKDKVQISFGKVQS